MPGPIRACFVVNAVDETSVPADIAAALVEHTGVEVDVLAWFDAGGFGGDDAVGVACLDAPDTALGIDRRTYRDAVDALRGYDVVQAHHPHSGTFAKLIARRLGIPSVSREGNVRAGFTRKGLLANGLTNPLSDRVVPNSPAVYDSFRRWERALLSGDAVEIIPNGVDFDRVEAGLALDWGPREATGIDPDATLVGTAGLLTEQKAHGTLVRAVAAANDRDRLAEPLDLVIAGDGPRRDDLERLAADRGVADRVHFLGYLDRLRVYATMGELDVYAMPSRWEGFSAAAVEALGVGTACVFSDIPPFREPYGDVALFHPVDDHAALADRLVDLATAPDRRAELGRRGRELVREQYTMERVAQRYRDLYRDVVG